MEDPTAHVIEPAVIEDTEEIEVKRINLDIRVNRLPFLSAFLCPEARFYIDARTRQSTHVLLSATERQCAKEFLLASFLQLT